MYDVERYMDMSCSVDIRRLWDGDMKPEVRAQAEALRRISLDPEMRKAVDHNGSEQDRRSDPERAR